MSLKWYYTTCGFVLTFANILLIETKFNPIGMFFGFLAFIYFIKAIRTKL